MNLDDIAYWLDTQKGLLMQTLQNSYTKNIDYIVMEIFNNTNENKRDYNNKILLVVSNKQDYKWGGHNHKTVLLTSDCFKMICMRSRTVKA